MNRSTYLKQITQHDLTYSAAESAVNQRADVAVPTRSDSAIVINCSNIKAALMRIQVTAGMHRDARNLEFISGLLPVLETLERRGEFKWSTLAKSLNELGLATPAGKRWGPVTVSRLIGALGDIIRTSKWTA